MKLKLTAALFWLLCLLTWFVPVSRAQVTPGCPSSSPSCVQVAGFTPVAATLVTAGTVSSQATLPVLGNSIFLVLTNNGTVQITVLLGNSSVVVTPTTGVPIQPAHTICLPQALNSTLASITNTSTAPMTVQSGTGACPTISYGSVTATGSLSGDVTTNPGSRAIIPLDASTVTTGGTAVTALSAGHAASGGYLVTSNSAGICVDQNATAGTVTGTPATTVCVLPYQTYAITPSPNAVSVNSSVSAVSFGGQGWE